MHQSDGQGGLGVVKASGQRADVVELGVGVVDLQAHALGGTGEALLYVRSSKIVVEITNHHADPAGVGIRHMRGCLHSNFLDVVGVGRQFI